jgi:hypothetical protein
MSNVLHQMEEIAFSTFNFSLHIHKWTLLKPLWKCKNLVCCLPFSRRRSFIFFPYSIPMLFTAIMLIYIVQFVLIQHCYFHLKLRGLGGYMIDFVKLTNVRLDIFPPRN